MAESPGEGQAPGQAGDQPAEPSSESAQRHGAAPGKGNTPARTPLTPYKRWTTPTAQASVNVRQAKPAGESHFRKACAWKRETLKAKEMPKAKFLGPKNPVKKRCLSNWASHLGKFTSRSIKLRLKLSVGSPSSELNKDAS